MESNGENNWGDRFCVECVYIFLTIGFNGKTSKGLNNLYVNDVTHREAYASLSCIATLPFGLPTSQDDLYSLLLPHKKACARFFRKITDNSNLHVVSQKTLRKSDKV